MLLRFRSAVPVFVNVTVTGLLLDPILVSANVTLPGCSITIALPMPVPVSAALCGLATALSERVTVPVRVPVAVGENTTEIEQLAPDGRSVPQLFVCEKS